MIARALSLDARVIFMDEATAALDEAEVKRLFDVIHRLTATGRSVVFVSHRLEEVLQLADHVTVFKDGRVAASVRNHEISAKDLIRWMVGREIASRISAEDSHTGPRRPRGAEDLDEEHPEREPDCPSRRDRGPGGIGRDPAVRRFSVLSTASTRCRRERSSSVDGRSRHPSAGHELRDRAGAGRPPQPGHHPQALGRGEHHHLVGPTWPWPYLAPREQADRAPHDR